MAQAEKFATLAAMLFPETRRNYPAFETALLLFIIAALTALLAGIRYFQGGQSYEFCHYGEIASNLLSGKGFVSAAQTPGNLVFLDAYGKQPAGYTAAFEANRFPLQTALIAGAQMFFGAKDFAVLAAQILVHSLWVVAIFLCGTLFFSRMAAFAAALLWALNPSLTTGIIPGGFPDLLSGLLCTLAAFLFLNALQRKASTWRFIGIGFICGCAYLSRFTVEIFAPLFPVFAISAQGWRAGLKTTLCLAAGALALVLPWTCYVYSATGSIAPPLFWTQLAAHTITGPIPWHEYRFFGPQDFAFPGALALIARKWLNHFFAFLREVPGLWFLHLAIPLALAFAIKNFIRKDGPLSLLKFYLTAFLLQTAGFSLLRHETLGLLNGRYYLWLGPVLLLAACEFMVEVKDALPRQLARLSPLTLFLAANLAVYSYCYARIETGSGHPSGLPVPLWPELAWARTAPSDSVIMSNIPNQIAWYANRASIALPPKPADLPALLQKHPATHLLLSRSNAGEPWNYPAWAALAQQNPATLRGFSEETGFTLKKEENGALLFEQTVTSAPAR